MDKILPYYERELSTFRRHMREFGQQYPKIASRLQVAGDMVEDPHIDRLIQAFSLIAARIDKKIDDSQKRLASAILEVIYPDYLRPYPSCSIAEFTSNVDLKQLDGEKWMPQQTTCKTKVVGKGVSLGFRTTQQVRFLPIQIQQFRYKKILPDQHTLSAELNGGLSLQLSTLNDSLTLAELLSKPIRLYIDAHPSLTVYLREILLSHIKGFQFTFNHVQLTETYNPLLSVGFDLDESILPKDLRALSSSRLLQEYFIFPEKFNFIDLDLSALIPRLGVNALNNVTANQTIDLRFLFKQDHGNIQLVKMLEQLDEKSLKLFCAPVVNLVKIPANPIKLNYQQAEFPLTPATLQPSYFEVYEVDKVTHVKDEQAQLKTRTFYPFFNLSHGNSAARNQYYHVYRDEQIAQAQPGYEYQISVSDHEFDATQAASYALSVNLWCTNRDIPSNLIIGHQYGDLFPDQSADFKLAKLLRRPTPSYRFDNFINEGEWRMVSKLTIDAVSLLQNQGEPLKEYLILHNPTNLEENQHKVDSILDCRATTKRRRLAVKNNFPVFCQGVELHVAVDDKKLVGSGVLLFAEVLSRTLALMTPLNTFIELVVFNKDYQKELVRCPPRTGQKDLL